jgi:hypothetical protein
MVISRWPRFQYLPSVKVIRVGNPGDECFHISEIDIRMYEMSGFIPDIFQNMLKTVHFHLHQRAYALVPNET